MKLFLLQDEKFVPIIALKIPLAFTVVPMKLCVVMKELTVNYKQAYDNHTPSSENILITTSIFCHFYGSWKCTFEMYSTLKRPNNPRKENL